MSSRNTDLKALLTIALPMIISQASETVMMFADRLFLSWLGKAYISAAMSGGLSSFVFMSLFTGTVGYVNALSAQYYGAGEEGHCVRTVTQGVRLSLLFYPLGLLFIPLVGRFFQVSGHSPEQIVLETVYFRILMLGGIFALIRTVFAGFFLGIGKTRTVMFANLAGMLINIPVNYVLIFGKLGFPEMGISGAAIGTLAGSFLISLILLIAFLKHKIYREHHSPQLWKFNKLIMGKLLRYGMPAGIELFLNVFAFNLFVQMMHSYSADVAAAVTITFNYDMVVFIPMLGLGFAITSLVGQQMGADNPEGALKVSRLAMKVGALYGFSMVLLFLFMAGPLVSVFTGGLSESDGAVVALSKSMLRLASIYIIADVVQLVFSGTLRGAGDTKWVMYISVVMHWILAFMAWLMIKVLVLHPLVVWLGFISFIVLLGLSMFLRYKFGPWKEMRIIQ
ncbi:MATE family efflux transporter [Spirochaeta isovalerica]|uniref:Multidrug-efflux transporter n=1 Tax=Spirochaeta isovalerica TaxID=150 RepID=A0A841R872_9SPIO|nr:MATE family efflux transporter [Spirochaeta isovalerica]MBB6479561.1 MATE family multidrug resistance protein [Spirochaeta isovalerica]